jgi:peptidoglycan/LPS O-acetylase OafA/YrhL
VAARRSRRWSARRIDLDPAARERTQILMPDPLAPVQPLPERVAGMTPITSSRPLPARPLNLRSHMPPLDGLRGVAILLVLLVHFTMYGGMSPSIFVDRAFYRVMTAGWVGVDLFFVLSGFLITGILYDAKSSASYFRTFYARRALRILPLYYGSLLWFCLIAPRLWPQNPGFRGLQQNGIWYWSYLVNVMVAKHGWSSFGAIEHYWSLAIEEQFYFLWPAVVFLLQRRAIMIVCVACMLGSLMLRIGLQLGDYRLAAYVLSPARLDTLAVGSFLALAARGPGGLERLMRWARPVAGASAAALFAIFLWRRGLPYEDLVVGTVGYSLLAFLFGAVLVIALTSVPTSATGRLFTSSGLMLLGRYSYAIYVFHHPVLFLKPAALSVQAFPRLWGSQLPGQIMFMLVATALSIGAGALSWHLFEKQFLKLRALFPYRPPSPSGRSVHEG